MTMEAMPTLKQEETEVEKIANGNEVNINETAGTKEDVKSAEAEKKTIEKEAKKVEEVKKQGWLKSKIGTLMDKLSGKVSREEALKIIMGHPAKRAALADIKKQYPERAEKYIEFISKFPDTNEAVKWRNGEFVHLSDVTEGTIMEKLGAGTGGQTLGK